MEYFQMRRTARAFWLFILGFCLLGIRLYIVQIRDGGQLAERAQSQQNQIVGLEEVPRGDIYDRNMVQLTGDCWVPKVVLFPYLMRDRAYTASVLAPILQIDMQELTQEMKLHPLALVKDLGESQDRLVHSLRLPGVRVYSFKQRYNKMPLAVHLIGHLGKPSEKVNPSRGPKNSIKGSELVGKLGLEKYYDAELAGTKHEELLAIPIDAKKVPLKGLGVTHFKQKDPQRKQLVLTIDRRIQQLAEQILDQNRVVSGSIVVMDVKTGDILAMASRPAFNPTDIQNALATASPGGNVFLDNNTQLIQPGSVFKPVIAAAAIDKGIVCPETRFLCLGDQDQYVRCYRAEGHGVLTFTQAMSLSCNPVFARVGEKLGANAIIDYATRMGFADQNIIGLPPRHDARQDLQQLKRPHSLVNASIGQGSILATPVQVPSMIATFARGGVFKQPRLVMKITDSSFNCLRQFPADKGKRVISAPTSQVINDMLKEVTTTGTGKLAYVPGWGSAGKTGSAQVNKNQGIVDAWFTGYAPIGKPRYAATVLVNSGESGGKSAAPLFSQLMKSIMNLESFE